jgi:hypothetical protein
MRKITTTLTIALLIVSFTAKSQNCASAFFPTKEGTKTETTSYDKKGKPQGKSTTTIVSVKQSGPYTIIEMKSEGTDAKNNPTSTEYTAKCDGENFLMNMKGLIPSDMTGAAGQAQITVDANEMAFPNNLTVGQKLNDGSATITMAMGAMSMTTVIKFYDRTVKAKESLTTTAGTFECYRIEYDIETTVMGMKVVTKSKVWVAKGVGFVKNETYSDKGELMGYSLLTAIK